MKKTIWAILFSAICLVSCKKNDDNAAVSSSNDPKTGSRWVYTVKLYNEAGTVTGTSTLTLVGTEITVLGSKWISMVDQATSAPVIALQKRTEGWWYLPTPGTASSLWFKYPAVVNETYPYVYGTCTVKDINASVTVPAGTFTGCYFVEGNDTNSLEDEFWFTNTGAVMVRFYTYDEKAAGPASNVYRKQSLELVSYTP